MSTTRQDEQDAKWARIRAAAAALDQAEQQVEDAAKALLEAMGAGEDKQEAAAEDLEIARNNQGDDPPSTAAIARAILETEEWANQA